MEPKKNKNRKKNTQFLLTQSILSENDKKVIFSKNNLKKTRYLYIAYKNIKFVTRLQPSHSFIHPPTRAAKSLAESRRECTVG